MARKLALKVDVDSYRGARDGLPRLVELLKRREAGATFFFGLGPDHGGLYGKALPAPDIGRRCAQAMRAARDAGFEVGLQAWSCARWRRQAMGADAEWTARQMALAMERFEEVFGERATVHAAPGWRMNKHAFRNTQALGFDYASDTRGTHPFVPIVRGEIVTCPQVPTTLPTLEEAIGHEGVTPGNAADRLLEKTQAGDQHVFTLHAASALKLAPVLDALLEGWKAQDYEVVALNTLVRDVAAGLPMHRVIEGPVALQGPEFLPEAAAA